MMEEREDRICHICNNQLKENEYFMAISDGGKNTSCLHCELNIEEIICNKSFDHCCPTIKEALDFIHMRFSKPFDTTPKDDCD